MTPFAALARTTILAGLAALLLAAPAGAHGGAHRAGMDERELRALETLVLGHAHAAEHARQRRHPARPAPPRARKAAVAADVGGRWNAAFPLPVIGVNAVVLPTGKVLLWAYPVAFRSPEAQAFVWDPAKGTGPDAFVRRDPPINPDTGRPVNIWCAGQSLLADGRVLVAGGNLRYDREGGYRGLRRVYLFDPFTETWAEQPSMRRGRWYPTQTLMPDGRTLIMSGIDDEEARLLSRDLELFTPPAEGATRGTISLLGPPDLLGSAGAPPAQWDTYPHVFWMPSGRALVAGSRPADTWFLDAPGPRDVFSWRDGPDQSQRRVWGSGVLLADPDGRGTRVMKIGGAARDAATATTEVLDEADPGAGWRPGPALNHARHSANTVLLPDGGLVTVGGGTSLTQLAASRPELRQVELLDPGAGEWRLGAEQAEYRAYHSTAILLPDGRVLSAGDDSNGGIDRDTGEIYEPPYLHRGPRPVIDDAPAWVSHGSTFAVGTRSAVARAVLVAPGATTHANDMHQRHVELRVAGRRSGAGVDLVAPDDVDVAPPGYYMLFLLDAQGVPSVARFVRLGPGAPAAPAAPAPVPGDAPQTPETPASPAPADPAPAPTAPAVPTPRAPAAPAPRAPAAPAAPATPAPAARPQGLRLAVFATPRLSGRATRSLVPRVALPRRRGAFGARWTGRLAPTRSGRQRVRLVADGRVRLWVGGRLVVDAWKAERTRARTHTVLVRLAAGRPVAVRLDYGQRRGAATLRLTLPGGRLTPG